MGQARGPGAEEVLKDEEAAWPFDLPPGASASSGEQSAAPEVTALRRGPGTVP